MIKKLRFRLSKRGAHLKSAPTNAYKLRERKTDPDSDTDGNPESLKANKTLLLQPSSNSKPSHFQNPKKFWQIGLKKNSYF